MAVRNWQPVKICFCQHIGRNVAFEAELIYPSETLPDTPPRVNAHRCSHGMECNLDGRPSCLWAGTNPAVDPFNV
jgi:hypothetical protein